MYLYVGRSLTGTPCATPLRLSCNNKGRKKP
jgi:hypothetical protein